MFGHVVALVRRCLGVCAAAALAAAVLAGPAPATSAGGNGAIAYTAGSDFAAREKHLIEVAPDGSGRVQLTGLDGPVNDLAPVFSPDGNQVAIGRCAPQSGGCGTSIPVWIMRADGTGARFLTTSIDGTASWSPDGSRLVVLDDTPALGVYVVNADGTGRHLLIKRSTGGTGSPTWSPDGQRIAFFDDTFPGKPQALGLYLVDVAGAVDDEGRKHLLLADQDPGTGAGACNDITGYAFDWSPDGTRLLYQCYETNGTDTNADIAVVDATTGAASRIVATPGQILTGTGIEWFPRWSPDGTRIVYERDGAVWTATAAGAEQHAVATPGFRPAWQPCVAATTRCGSPPAPVTPGGTTTPGTSTGPGTTTPGACPSAAGCPRRTFSFGTPVPTHRGTRLTVEVPGPGTVSVAKTRRTLAARVHARAAGSVRLTVKLSAAGRLAVRRPGKLTVPLTVRFRPDGATSSASRQARIKFIR